MTKNTKTYQELKNELDKVLSRLEADDIDIDKSLELYKAGQQLVGQLEKYLASVKAKIDIIKTEQ